MQPAVPSSSTPKSMADQLKDLAFVLRSDLHVSRQLHQDQPVYVVHDPVSFRTHRLSLQNYQVLVRLNASKSLGENFETLLKQGHLEEGDREFFYQFVMQSHQLGILVLPVANGQKLFEQHEKLRQAKRRSKIFGALFLQIPLARPDGFLTRTAPRMQWLFSRAFVAIWAVAGLIALSLIGSRFAEFVQPLNGLLATENLPFLWITFVGLKIWHELGHGYACKIFGGAVPEMGMLLIVGTPAAYVDATAAWSFPERWKRLVVMLGGMYFETIVAIPAVFIWAFSASPMLSSCAYQLVMMASLITVLFNANPLMKYDGYFIASELLGMQNLRGRSEQYVKGLMKRVFLGLPLASAPRSLREKAILASYGVAASIYRISLVLAIAMMIAYRFPLIGLAIAGYQLSSTIGSTWWKLGQYLLKSPETVAVRSRALLLAAVALIVIPLSTLVVPMPFGVVAQGVVAAQSESYLNAKTPGRFITLNVMPGDQVQAGTELIILQNQDVSDRQRSILASLQEALLQREIFQDRDLVKASQLEPRIRELKQQLLEQEDQLASLSIRAAGPGRVARLLPKSQLGRQVGTGETVAVVVNGRPLLRTWLSEDQLGSLDRTPGSALEFRLAGRSESTYSATLLSIEPAAETASLNQALTTVAGGEVILDPRTGLPLTPLFQVDAEPVDSSVLQLSDHGLRVSLNLSRRRETIASWLVNRVSRFVQKTLMA